MFKVRKESQQVKQTTITDKIIDPATVESMRLAVYHNEHKALVSEVDFEFKTAHQDFGDKVKLRNDLYKLENIRYKLPSGWKELQPWYEHAIKRASDFEKQYPDAGHCKLGKKFERWLTIPLTFFSYSPSSKIALLQFSILTDSGLFDAHAEVEVELEKSGANNIHYQFVDSE